MKGKIQVLYIDDEENNLSSFKASLRKDFKIYTVNDPEEGLKLAEEVEFQVAIADQRMPGMTGVEFFEKMVKFKPEPIRILLTGYSDIASVIDAINKGEVYRFIDKPWNIEQIKNAIYNAADLYYTRKELREKNDKLKKTVSEMNIFIHSLSHDLRGPLMSISGVSKLAKTEISDPAAAEYFDMIDSATVKLDDFIYKMLDFYRSTKIDNIVIPIDFNSVVEQQFLAYKEKWDFSNVNVSVKVDQQEDFYSDDGKIRVILNNLIGNAYKFQNDEAEVNMIALEIGVFDGIAKIKVSDNGIGIDEKHQKDVFNLFHRATQKNVGSGLGLYMVKESVEQIKGEILLQSTVGVGTVVEITLPNLKEA